MQTTQRNVHQVTSAYTMQNTETVFCAAEIAERLLAHVKDVWQEVEFSASAPENGYVDITLRPTICTTGIDVSGAQSAPQEGGIVEWALKDGARCVVCAKWYIMGAHAWHGKS